MTGAERQEYEEAPEMTEAEQAQLDREAAKQGGDPDVDLTPAEQKLADAEQAKWETMTPAQQASAEATGTAPASAGSPVAGREHTKAVDPGAHHTKVAPHKKLTPHRPKRYWNRATERMETVKQLSRRPRGKLIC